MYGNQKLNIWEFQKEQVRKQITNDTKNFYTYSKDFLSLAFPLINENEIKMKEKEDSEAKWKTKTGFDNVLKKSSFTEHPKKPPQSIIDDLQIPYVEQLKEKMEALKGRAPIITGGDVPDFQTNFKVPPTFAERAFFNTVFISGDDMVKEQQELIQKELDTWKSKVVVANPHFQVDTRQYEKPGQKEKHRGMLDGDPKKVGLRLSQKRIKEQVARQVLITKKVEHIPSTIFADVEFKDPMIKSTLKDKDPTKSIGGHIDFNTNIKNDVLSKSPTSKKVFIQPLASYERSGSQWYGNN